MIVHDTPRDDVFRGRKVRTAHMASTLHGAEGTRELLAFGKRIGLREGWIQARGTPTEHFDLFGGAIQRAIDAGSTEIEPRELIAMVVRPKRAAAAEARP